MQPGQKKSKSPELTSWVSQDLESRKLGWRKGSCTKMLTHTLPSKLGRLLLSSPFPLPFLSTGGTRIDPPPFSESGAGLIFPLSWVKTMPCHEATSKAADVTFVTFWADSMTVINSCFFFIFLAFSLSMAGGNFLIISISCRPINGFYFKFQVVWLFQNSNHHYI